MDNKDFLESYEGQSVDELISLEQEYRIESIVMAFEEALDQKASEVGLSNLTDTERIVLAIEALEREVNNGGYHQFFSNSSNEYAVMIVKALEEIACPKTARITHMAIGKLEINGPLTVEAITAAIDADEEGDDCLLDILSELDDQYFDSGEMIADRLFHYIKDHKSQINL